MDPDELEGQWHQQHQQLRSFGQGQGNLRECAHLIDRCIWESPEVALASKGAGAWAEIPRVDHLIDGLLDAGLTEKVMQEQLATRAIERTNGNVTDAAELLGLARGTLYKRLGRSS